MAGIAIILPNEKMIEAAQEAASHFSLKLVNITTANRFNLVQEVSKSIEKGAEIIISRGVIADEIQRLFSIPVVQIRLTMHEVILLFQNAKNFTSKEVPHIALIGPKNMFCDLSTMLLNRLCNVQAHIYLFDRIEETQPLVLKAISDKADVIIGGSAACQCAVDYGVPSVRTSSGSESLEYACRMAEQMGEAIDLEKKNSANFQAIINYVYAGIIQIDECGRILHVNQFIEDLFRKSNTEMHNQYIWDLIPDMKKERLSPVLCDKKEVLSTLVTINHSEFMTSITPILMNNQIITGAVICFHEGRQIALFSKEKEQFQTRKGYYARYHFDEIISRSTQMQKIIRFAKQLCNYTSPLLILGEEGSGQLELAEAIHNESSRSSYAFISFICDGYSPMEAELLLFGRPASKNHSAVPGLAEQPQSILYLHNISALSSSIQFKLQQLITRHTVSAFGEVTTHRCFTRIIASDSHDLRLLTAEGKFRHDLYYALCANQIYLPPLRERREDIEGYIMSFLKLYQQEYGRFVHITKDALQVLHDYDWPGNIPEIRSTCRKILATATSRTVDARFVSSLLDPLPVHMPTAPSCSPRQDYYSVRLLGSHQRALQLANVLKKYNGNRKKAAIELGISTSTLWRWMKKYGLSDN
ncbi:MAG TPA: PrpR N-terminal domain-containing protein [Candidatus Cottocaccamicrobium excrementipullorum]|nr:PrpR N-terminal domain-containing protein [Candidatus Cottocaccamicrobium excrementipullorum]